MIEGGVAPPPVPLTAKASGDTTTPVEPGTTQIEATAAVTFAVG